MLPLVLTCAHLMVMALYEGGFRRIQYAVHPADVLVRQRHGRCKRSPFSKLALYSDPSTMHLDELLCAVSLSPVLPDFTAPLVEMNDAIATDMPDVSGPIDNVQRARAFR